MSKDSVSTTEIARLRELASVLIPASAKMPGAVDIPDFDQWLARAVRASGYSPADRQSAVEALPEKLTWESTKILSLSNPEGFAIVSTIVSAAYYMTPAVLAKLGYPDDRKNPAGMEEFVAEFETGIFDQMMARQPHFRVVPK